MTRPRLGGRHRLGRPGLIAATVLVTVPRRGFFRSWFRPARHHRAAPRVSRPRPGRVPVPAAG